MEKQVTRRAFTGAVLTTAAGALAVNQASAQIAQTEGKILIVGIACSPRKGKTTATAMQTALNAAQENNPRIETKLLDLGGMNIAGYSPTPTKDDFNSLLPILKAQNLGGMIIGSPAYFRNMSALCKAFIERLAALRKPKLLLAGVPVGVLSVGAYRNGGQELVIEQIQNAMLCHEALIVGGKSPAYQGATLWNSHKDDISKDTIGMMSASKLGLRVAEAALAAK
jgi:multimeric flavodoxin WrbA